MKGNMKGFWRRLWLYGIGFTISAIFVYFLFGTRSCTWMPGDRVKSGIFRKLIVFPEDQIKSLDELGIDKSNIYKYLAKGNIDFSESLKDLGVYPKVYVYKRNDTIDKRLQISMYEDGYIGVIHVLDDDMEPKRYEELEGFGDIVHLPRDSSLVYIDQSNYMQCKARGLGSKDYLTIIKDIKNTGRINFSKSKLMLPKAEQQLYFIQNDTIQVEAKTIWYKDKINFKDFIWDYKLPCED